MTISNTTYKVRVEGNDSATSFSFSPMVVQSASQLEVTLLDSDGETELVEGTGTANYSVSVSSFPGTGSITYPASGSGTLAAGEFLVIRRETDFLQSVDLENQGGYFPETQEDQYDKFAMADLQQQEEIERTLRVRISEDLSGKDLTLPSLSNRASKHLAFNSDGEPIASGGTTEVTVSSFMETVLDDADADTAIATLELSDTDNPTHGDAHIGYKRTETGGVARTVHDWMQDQVFNVKDFGATGDGVVDDTSFIQAALDAANTAGGGTVFFPAGTYNMGDTGTLTGYTKVSLVGERGQAELDFSNRTSLQDDLLLGLILYKGTAGSGVLSTDTTTDLSSNAAIGDTTLTLDDTSALSAGDLIEVTETGNGQWTDSSITVRVAQLVEIVSVDSSAQITISAPCLDAYTTANSAGVRLVVPVEDFEIRGLTIRGQGRDASVTGDIGLSIFYGKNFAIRDCTFIGVDARSINPVSCFKFVIEDNDITTDAQGGNTKVNYGVAYTSACTYGTIKNNRFTNWRHGIVSSHLSMALSEEYPGVSRFINVEGNHVENTWHAGIATHNDAEMLNIRGNNCINCAFGLNFRDKNVRAEGNGLYYCTQGIILSARPRHQFYADNEIVGGENAITFQSIDASFTIQDLAFRNNRISKQTEGGIILTDSTGSGPYWNISIVANSIFDITGSGSAAAIRLVGNKWVANISDNSVHDTDTIAGIRIDNGIAGKISDNIIIDTSEPINLPSGAEKITVRGNIAGTYTASEIFTGVGTNCNISDNIDLGSGAIS